MSLQRKRDEICVRRIVEKMELERIAESGQILDGATRFLALEMVLSQSPCLSQSQLRQFFKSCNPVS